MLSSYFKIVLIISVLMMTLSPILSIISGEHQFPFQQQIGWQVFGKNRDWYQLPSTIVSECVFVTSESGKFVYKSNDNDDTVCGIYFLSDPDRIIEITFLALDVPCEHGGLVSFVDGWELNGEIFPPAEDHQLPLEKRYNEFCGKYVNQKFLSSQNAAVIQYRIPFKGKGFTVIARHRKTPTPCNMLVNSTTDLFTLRNFGRAKNCTIAAVYPSALRIITLNVGNDNKLKVLRQKETGTIHNCNERGMKDHVQIGGSNGLDTSKTEVLESICGLDSKPGKFKIIGCEVTSIKLISSGYFDNSVSVFIRPIDETEILNSNIICGL